MSIGYRPLAPGTEVDWREPVWDGTDGPVYTHIVERSMPDMIRFEDGEFTSWSDVVNIRVKFQGELHTWFCAACGVDMLPADDDWVTCPNAGDLCIDCCGELH